ncbi:DddA-like double-stranded DNA deaminase toxin [Micromonospora sp. NPDC003197]
MSVAEVSAALRAIVDSISRERGRAAGVLRAVQDSRSRLGVTLRGSRHPLVGRALDGFAAAIERLREADHLAAQSAEAVRAYANAIGIDLPAPSSQSADNAGQTGTSVQRAAGDVLPTQEWVEDAGGRLPRRPGGKGPTHGLLFDISGTPLTGTPLTQSEGYLRSGRAPGARDGLRQDWHPLAQVTREHVEAHAAALLRKPGAPREAVVVVNKPTCVSKGEYVGCDEVLPGMLPRGSRLAVYVSDGATTRLLKVYTGTGEGIAS